jgi:hypothetical protein
MRRDQLEHILRAASGITGQREFVVIGSQAILGQFPDAPDDLLVSMEADVFCQASPEATDLVDGTIGELSPFQQTFGYYAHGVGPETAILPAGWERRLVRVESENTGLGVGLCLEVHDLLISKLAAGREKDLAFVAVALRHHLASPAEIESRLPMVPVSSERLETLRHRLRRALNPDL